MNQSHIKADEIITHRVDVRRKDINLYVDKINSGEPIDPVVVVPVGEAIAFAESHLTELIQNSGCRYYTPNGTHRSIAYREMGRLVPIERISLDPGYILNLAIPLRDVRILEG